MGGFFFEGSSFYQPYLELLQYQTDILLLTKHQHPTDDRPLSFLSDLSPIIGYACHSLTHWLIHWLPFSKLVDVATVANFDDEDHVGNSLLQI